MKDKPTLMIISHPFYPEANERGECVYFVFDMQFQMVAKINYDRERWGWIIEAFDDRYFTPTPRPLYGNLYHALNAVRAHYDWGIGKVYRMRSEEWQEHSPYRQRSNHPPPP